MNSSTSQLIENSTLREISNDLFGSEFDEILYNLMNQTAIVVAILGILGNVFNFIVILSLRGRHGFLSGAAGLIILHQSIIDAVATVAELLHLFIDPSWVPSGFLINWIICKLWNGTVIFYLLTILSTHNVVFLTIERYIALNHPFFHKSQTQCKILFSGWGYVYIISLLISFPNTFNNQLIENNECIPYFVPYPFSEFPMGTLYIIYQIAWCLINYVFPALASIILSFLIIYNLKRKTKFSQESGGVSSDKKSQAAKELTIIAILQSFFFITCLAPDSINAIFYGFHLVDWTLFSPVQRLGTFMITINLAFNPYICFLLLPNIRKKILKIFTICRNDTIQVTHSKEI